MLTIRIDKNTEFMIAFLKNNKVKYATLLKPIIKKELEKMCADFKMKQKRIKNAPDWMYDN